MGGGGAIGGGGGEIVDEMDCEESAAFFVDELGIETFSSSKSVWKKILQLISRFLIFLYYKMYSKPRLIPI